MIEHRGNDRAPALSVVLVAGSGVRAAGRTLEHLLAQTIAGDLEVLVVCTHADAAALVQREHPFCALRAVTVDTITARGEAAALGFRAATAPFIGLVEDHSFPAPQWAHALVGTLRDGWDGVGPLVQNANPTVATSWVNFLLSYGQLSLGESGERALIPWHNSAYRREVLLPFWDQLGALLEWEGWLQDAVRARGARLYFATEATTAHLNVSRPLSSLKLNLIRGRAIGATRRQHGQWSRGERFLRAPAVVLSPWVNLRINYPALRNAHLPLRRHVRVLAALVPNLVAVAIGEATGIVRGIGRSVQALEDFELNRARYIMPSEQVQMHGASPWNRVSQQQEA